mmetsp:Transcript_2312/g.7832  ORF Transcript_2312/g.7832 Transcript_2312/m.7832 type:complete len:225 (-) Transcript_2312:13-687(-)
MGSFLGLVAPGPWPTAPQEERGTKRLLQVISVEGHFGLLEISKSAARTSNGTKLKKAGLPNVCALCSSRATEAAHIVQKQDANDKDNVECDAVDIERLKDTEVFYRPFDPNDIGNYILLCHNHNLAFDAHDFQLVLTEGSGGGHAYEFRTHLHDRESLAAVQLANSEQKKDVLAAYKEYVFKRAVAWRNRRAAKKIAPCSLYDRGALLPLAVEALSHRSRMGSI